MPVPFVSNPPTIDDVRVKTFRTNANGVPDRVIESFIHSAKKSMSAEDVNIATAVVPAGEPQTHSMITVIVTKVP